MARLNLILKNFFSNKTYVFCITSLIIFAVYFLYLKSDSSSIIQETPKHCLCVLVPYRDVIDELLEFIPFMNKFLNRQSIKFHFVVVNHVPDGNRFNKGAILNAGYKIILEQYVDCDYLAIHDIDLLPLNDNISYAYPGNNVYHVANPEVVDHNLQRYTGGIIIISNEQYRRINGFGNQFWGWGFEDRNFFHRISKYMINTVHPSNFITDHDKALKNIHPPCRARDKTACGYQKKSSLCETDFETGLNDVKYELISVRSIKIDEIPLTMFSMSIPCNYFETSWCKLNCLL